jgi:hypothetical protein
MRIVFHMTRGKSRKARRNGLSRSHRSAAALQLERLEERSLLATFTVINTDDSGAGSLRQAILDSNSDPGTDRITFAMPANDPNQRHFYYQDDHAPGHVSLGSRAQLVVHPSRLDPAHDFRAGSDRWLQSVRRTRG